MPQGPARGASIARRVLAVILAGLSALQPIGATSPGCTIGGLVTGRGVCCCATQESCCSAASPAPAQDGVFVKSEAERCTCEVDAPQPVNALPRASGASAETGSARALLQWIDRGALASACTPILSTASPPGEIVDPGAAPAGLRPPAPGSSAPGFARGARGLLAVTCVARC